VIATAARRVVRLAGTGALVLGGCAALAAGVAAATGELLRSTLLPIERLEVRGNARATEEEIRSLAGGALGAGLFTVDREAIAHAVERHPWVARATIRRQLPTGLVIEVAEHQPVALVALGQLYYVDAEGAIVKRHAAGEPTDFPVITGLRREDVEREDGLALGRLRSAISFLDQARAVYGDRAPIDEVHLDPVAGLSFVSAGPQLEGGALGRAPRVYLGRPPWRDALAELEEVKAELQQRGLQAIEIRLGAEQRPERAVVRLAAAGAGGSGTDDGR
jgi:cell division protein FtsQ